MMKCMHEWAVRHGLLLQASLQLPEPKEPYQPEFDDEDDESDDYCETCDNMGVVDCFCGGDLCVCRNNGEKPCPDCSNY